MVSHADVDTDWDASSTTICPFCETSPCTGVCLRSPKYICCCETSKSGNNCRGDVSTFHPVALATVDVDKQDVALAVPKRGPSSDHDGCLLLTSSKPPTGAVCARRDREIVADLPQQRPSRSQSPEEEDIGDDVLAQSDTERDEEDGDTLLQTCPECHEITFRVVGEAGIATGETNTIDNYNNSHLHLVSQNSALAAMRSRVSQLKRRYQRDGFDLDLTYITPRIIAMGFPAWGTEKYYRNPIDEVELFLKSRHGGHYRVYNLCSERLEYDSPKRFQGNCRRFPFKDHNVPCPISLIADFVCDAIGFLEEHTSNVVVVHCKAGKGRTGVMVSCLLLSLNPLRFSNAEEALHFFAETRTYDGLGVTIPSQCRYVHYYDRILREFGGKPLPPRALRLYQITIDSEIKPCAQVDVYFIVEENGSEKIDSRRVFSRGPVKDAKGFIFLFPGEEPLLEGDLRFAFYQRNRIVDTELFYFWLNTSLCGQQEQLSLKNRQLDGRPAKSKDEEIFCKDLSIDVIFVEGLANDTNSLERAEATEEAVVPKNTQLSTHRLTKGLQRFVAKFPLS